MPENVPDMSSALIFQIFGGEEGRVPFIAKRFQHAVNRAIGKLGRIQRLPIDKPLVDNLPGLPEDIKFFRHFVRRAGGRR